MPNGSTDSAAADLPAAAGGRNFHVPCVSGRYYLMLDLLAGDTSAVFQRGFPGRISDLISSLVSTVSANGGMATELMRELDEAKEELGEAQGQLDAAKEELGEAKGKLGETEEELDETKRSLDAAKEEVAALERKLRKAESRLSDALLELYGSRSECMPDRDRVDGEELDSDGLGVGGKEASDRFDYASDGSVSGKKPGTGARRKVFAAFLDRVEEYGEYEDDCCPRCKGREFWDLGEVRTETLAERVVQNYVRVHVRRKRKCCDCETVVWTKPRKSVFNRRFLDPSLVARVAVECLIKGVSVNRLAAEFSFRGISLSAELLNRYFIATGNLLEPLVEFQKKDLFEAERIFLDDTRLPLNLEEPRGRLTRGHAWFYLRNDRAFGGTGPAVVCVKATADWKAEHPKQFLLGYGGIIQGDSYPGWKSLCAESCGRVVLATCWAHARRRFVKGLKRKHGFAGPDRDFAQQVLAIIRRIFKIERKTYGRKPGERLAVRLEESAPLVSGLERLLREKRRTLDKGSDLIQCIDYLLNSWENFTLFLESGLVCLTTNLVEGLIRKYADGRKNWGHRNSMEGAEAHSNLASLIFTCVLNDINPYQWLTDVLNRWPDTPGSERWKLVPYNWIKHFGDGPTAPSAPGGGGSVAAPDRPSHTDTPDSTAAAAADDREDLPVSGRKKTNGDIQAADPPRDSQARASAGAGNDMAVHGEAQDAGGDSGPDPGSRPQNSPNQIKPGESGHRHGCRNGTNRPYGETAGSDGSPVPLAPDHDRPAQIAESTESDADPMTDAGNPVKTGALMQIIGNFTARGRHLLQSAGSVRKPLMARIRTWMEPAGLETAHSMLQATGSAAVGKFASTRMRTAADFSRPESRTSECAKKQALISRNRDPPKFTGTANATM